MAKSLITTPGIALKHQSIKDFPDLIKGWLRAELGLGKHVGRFSNLVDFIVVRQLKSDLHLMHRHSTLMPKAPVVVRHQPRMDTRDMVVVRIIKRGISQINRFHVEKVFSFFCHGRIFSQLRRLVYSSFPSDLFVHAFTVSGTATNKYVRGISL